MKFKRYLIEKTFTISKDVKYVYENGFKPLVDEIQKQAVTGKFIDFNQYAVERLIKGKYGWFFTDVRKGYGFVLFKEMKGEELPSNDAKNATKMNPVTIQCGVFTEGNFYRPNSVGKILDPKGLTTGGAGRSLISLSLNGQALRLGLNGNQQNLDKGMLAHFNQEFTPERIKATIAHEISHWMNDTLNNFHISNLLKTAHELKKNDLLLLHKKNVNMTHFEIDAQIHGIKQLKMQHKKDWDNMTLKDIFFLYNSLRHIGGDLIYGQYGKEVGDLWQKTLVKRLARENLLGKNMKNFAKYPEDFK